MPAKEKPLLTGKEKPPRVLTALKGADGLSRCPWPGVDPLYVAYHDEEWGVPEYDDHAMFEKLVLDGFQAGLSWITILRKRPAFRQAFDGFDPKKIVRWSDKKKDALMQDAGIIRNRAKIEATVALARITLDFADKGGLARHLWSFVDGRPIDNARRSFKDVPAETCARGAAILSGRRSSTPSCRRPAWSMIISSIAVATRRAGRRRANSAHD
jgi:DNA-3-methyladenine glycosylase I